MPEWRDHDTERSDVKESVHTTSRWSASILQLFLTCRWHCQHKKTQAHPIEPCMQPLRVATSLYWRFTSTSI